MVIRINAGILKFFEKIRKTEVGYGVFFLTNPWKSKFIF